MSPEHAGSPSQGYAFSNERKGRKAQMSERADQLLRCLLRMILHIRNKDLMFVDLKIPGITIYMFLSQYQIVFCVYS
jgi:hypothetical protein